MRWSTKSAFGERLHCIALHQLPGVSQRQREAAPFYSVRSRIASGCSAEWRAGGTPWSTLSRNKSFASGNDSK